MLRLALRKYIFCYRYSQGFCSKWLNEREFKDWLAKKEVSGNSVPYCKVCKSVLSCAKTAIARHGKTKNHETEMKRRVDIEKSQPNISGFMGSSTSSNVAKMEIKICTFLTENNLPISLSEDLLAFLRSLFPSDEALKKVTLGKQKATNTVRQVLGFHFLKDGILKLRDHKFSLIIDETTDQSTKSQLALIGSYFDDVKYEITCVFIDLIEMPDGKANTIYNKMLECLNEKGIPIQNVIGFCADTCNTMFGKNHSVSQLLVSNHPWILPVKCSCHMINLCSSHASLKLPKSLEDLCRNLYAHFHVSSQRRNALAEFQDFLKIDRHQMLRAGHTRWLSMKMCVDRILEQYDALLLYFQNAVFEDPTLTNDSILRSLKNKFTKAYLEFMAFNLGRLVSFNLLFQSNIPLLHLVKREVATLISSMCSDFMHYSFIRETNAGNIDPHKSQHYVPLNKVYIGIAATDTLQSISTDLGEGHPDVQRFLTDCRAFLVECVHQIKMRFNNLEKFDFLQCISPAIACNMIVPSLSHVFKQMPYLKDIADLQTVDSEWRHHAMCPKVNSDMTIHEYWQTIFKEKNAAGNQLYPNLCKVISVLFSYPFSNASVERVFSQLKLIKRDHRTSLKQESLLALIRSKLGMQQEGTRVAASLIPSKDMLKLHSRMKANVDNDEAEKLRKQFLNDLCEELNLSEL